MRLLILGVLLLLSKRISSYSIGLESGKKQCFFVKAERETTLTGSYEVLDESAEPIEVFVKGPDKKIHYEAKYTGDGALDLDNSEGQFDFDADMDGYYKLCLLNGFKHNKNDGKSRVIGFNFRVLDLMGDDEEENPVDIGYSGLESELYDLQRGLDFLTDHQAYMNQREDLHKEELDSISSRVFMWTIVEALILVSLAGWQIMYIRSFFETKRRM